MVLPIIGSVLTLNDAEFRYVSCKTKNARKHRAFFESLLPRYLLVVVANTFSAARFFAMQASREDGASCRPDDPSSQRTSQRKFWSPYRLKISLPPGAPGRL